MHRSFSLLIRKTIKNTQRPQERALCVFDCLRSCLLVGSRCNFFSCNFSLCGHVYGHSGCSFFNWSCCWVHVLFVHTALLLTPPHTSARQVPDKVSGTYTQVLPVYHRHSQYATIQGLKHSVHYLKSLTEEVTMGTIRHRRESLGRMATFLMPSLKLKTRLADGTTVEEYLHTVLMQSFGGYTAGSATLFGF